MIFVFIFLISIFLLYFLNQKINKNYDLFLLKIDKSEIEIQQLVLKKKNIILDLTKNINLVMKKKVFKDLKTLEKETDNLKLDRELTSYNHELKEFLLINKEFVFEDKMNDKLNELEILNVNLRASKQFFNNNVIKYNEKVDKFPSSLIAKKRNIDFKYPYSLEKIEIFDILKRENNS